MDEWIVYSITFRVIICSMFQGFNSNLLVQFSVEVPASDEDGDDPEEAGEEDVEGDEEKEEPPDWRHLATMLSSRNQVICHDHWKLLAAIASSHTRILEMGEMRGYPPAMHVGRKRLMLMNRRVQLGGRGA